MPVYTFRNKETQEVQDKVLKYDEKEQYLKDNLNLEQIFTSVPGLCDPVRLGLRTTDSGFKEVIHKIADNNYKSNLKSVLSRN